MFHILDVWACLTLNQPELIPGSFIMCPENLRRGQARKSSRDDVEIPRGKQRDFLKREEKEWTGHRTEKYSTLNARVFAGPIPVDQIDEIKEFKGPNTCLLARALRLYVKVMGAETK
jgi:hypothetical protein